jgi:hypothetical protein
MTSIKELQITRSTSFKKDACFKCGICVNLPNGGRRRIDPRGSAELYDKPISDCSVKNCGVENPSKAEVERLLGKDETKSN